MTDSTLIVRHHADGTLDDLVATAADIALYRVGRHDWRLRVHAADRAVVVDLTTRRTVIVGRVSDV